MKMGVLASPENVPIQLNISLRLFMQIKKVIVVALIR